MIEEISIELREKIMSDSEIINLTKDIVRLRKEKQTDEIKEKIELLERLRFDIGQQYLKIENNRK